MLNKDMQKIGESVSSQPQAKFPDIKTITGQYTQIEHLNVQKHQNDIMDFYFDNCHKEDWTYLTLEPFETL